MVLGLNYSKEEEKLKPYGISDAYKDGSGSEKFFIIFLFTLLGITIIGGAFAIYMIWK